MFAHPLSRTLTSHTSGVRELPLFVRTTALPAYHCPDVPKAVLAAGEFKAKKSPL